MEKYFERGFLEADWTVPVVLPVAELEERLGIVRGTIVVQSASQQLRSTNRQKLFGDN